MITRQELQDGYQRNSIVSGLAEVGGVSMINANSPADIIWYKTKPNIDSCVK